MFQSLDPIFLVSVFLLVFYGVVAAICCLETLLESRRAGDRSQKGWGLAIVIGLLWPVPIVFVGLGYCLGFVVRGRNQSA